MTIKQARVRCELERDAMPPLALPVAKIYARTYSGFPSEFNLSIPSIYGQGDLLETLFSAVGETVFAYYDQISADGAATSAVLFSFVIRADTYQYDRGTSSATLTLRGTRQTTNSAPTDHGAIPVFAEGVGFDGQRFWDIPAMPEIQAGDTVTIEGTPRLIDRIQMRLSPSSHTFTLREAPQ